MRTTAARSRGWPLPARWALIGAAIACGIGTVAGVIVGLFVYPPTAFFAGAEIGIPATFAGAVLGAAAGVLPAAGRRAGRNPPADQGTLSGPA
jgi:hypothetical protein